mgnify:CR=1 FL=1
MNLENSGEMEEGLFKKAVLSMDVEDWYHLEYINNLKDFNNINGPSMKDGIQKYLDILSKYNLKANFFLVGNFIQNCTKEIQAIIDSQHEIGLHSFNHDRPITLSTEEFINDLEQNIEKVESLGIKPKGYRAPCFALGNSFLDLLARDFKNLLFDSSYIDQKEHPLYTPIDLNKLNFRKSTDGIFKKNGFTEFEVTTIKIYKYSIPISGGGYIRILPWFIYRFLLKSYLKTGQFYTFYIHPFELSEQKISLPKGVSYINRFRFHFNRKKTYRRTEKTIQLLKEYGYSFHTFSELTANNIH